MLISRESEKGEPIEARRNWNGDASFYSELRRLAEKPLDLISPTLRHLRAAPSKRITVAARADENRIDKIIALAQIARGPLFRICRNQGVTMLGKSEVSKTAKTQSRRRARRGFARSIILKRAEFRTRTSR